MAQDSVPECHHVIRIERDKVNIMNYDADRLALLPHQGTQQFHYARRTMHIKVVQRFIEKDVLRVLCNGHGNIGHLPLAARKLIKVAMAQIGNLGKFQSLFDLQKILIFQRPRE